jgi:hypothetical protein
MPSTARKSHEGFDSWDFRAARERVGAVGASRRGHLDGHPTNFGSPPQPAVASRRPRYAHTFPPLREALDQTLISAIIAIESLVSPLVNLRGFNWRLGEADGDKGFGRLAVFRAARNSFRAESKQSRQPSFMRRRFEKSLCECSRCVAKRRVRFFGLTSVCIAMAAGCYILFGHAKFVASQFLKCAGSVVRGV